MIAKRPAERLSVFIKCLLSISALLILTTVAVGEAPSATQNKEIRKQAVKSLMNRPLGFEVNEGQVNSHVKYFAKGNGYTLFLTANGAVISSAQKSAANVIRMNLLDANQHAQIAGMDRATTYSNYYIGNNPQNWHTHVAQYARVNYQNIYPGVDMVFHGAQSESADSKDAQNTLEFDFVVAPGADPQPVAMQFEGTDKMRTDAAGDLILSSGADIRLHKPIAYQKENGKKIPVEAKFVVANNQVRLALGNYDHSRELVIDPAIIALGYSTYLGGSAEDDAFGIAVDSTGAVYIAGQTKSSGFPPNASTVAPAGGFDAFITKVNANGTLAFTNYMGGAGDDTASAIAVDANGNIYIAGGTEGGFPVTGDAFQPSFGGGTTDAFVSKLDNTGSLQYSTYLGGDGDELAAAIAVDSNQNVYVTGQTDSSGHGVKFPVTSGTLQSDLKGTSNAFVSKFSLQGSGHNTLAYSSYLGGSAADEGNGIAVDSSGNFYVAGDTTSSDFFPSGTSGFQTSCGTAANCNSGLQDGFIAKFKSDGSALVYGTYLGGGDRDFIRAITVDSTGAAYVTGSTASSDFPKQNAFQASLASGASNAFITKLNPAGNALVFSTYFGGSGLDNGGLGIAVDSSLQNVYVTGETVSSDIPTPVNPLSGGSSLQGPSDAFIAEFKADGSAPIFSTYFGGTGSEDLTAGGIAVDGTGNIYVTGDTNSGDLPLQSAADGTYGGNTDAFLAKITGVNTPDFSTAATSASVVAGASGTSTVTLTRLYNFGDDITLACSAGLPAGANCSFSPATLTGSTLTSTLTVNADTSTPAGNSTVTVTATSSPGNIVHTTTFNLAVQDFSLAATAPATIVSGNSTSSTITVTPANGFSGDVNLTCSSGLPAGASCSFTPSPVTGGSGTSTLTISTTSATPVGNSTITITATAGSLTHTTTVSLAVQDFSITAIPVVGTNGEFTVTTTPINGFAGNVSLSCTSGLPTGANCSFVPSQVTGGAGASILTITTTIGTSPSGSTPPGSYTVTITATSGAVTHTTTVTLNVQAAPVPDFSFSAGAPSAATINAGTSDTSTITATAQNGFAMDIALTCSVAPVKTLGPSCNFNPAKITGGNGTSTLTISTTAAVASLHTPGSHAAWLYAMSLPFGEVLLVGAGFSERKKLRKKMMRFLFAGALFCGLLMLAACGNSNSTSGGGTGGNNGGGTPGTPAGQYTVTVTGTAGSTVHTTTVNVTVQ